MKPVVIFIGGEELTGWTDMTLSRSKKDLTGSLSVSLFFSYVPDKPVAINATKNKDITVYIGGHLAFTGKIDKRRGTGAKHGASGTDSNERQENGSFGRSSSISADEYTVKISARGKTKQLIESSHQHPTTNMMQPTNKEAIEKLVQPWNIELDWLAETIKLDKVRFRDGNTVVDEIQRLSRENGHFAYETREGKLRITDNTGRQEGEALVLGHNISTFSAEQSEEESKSKVKVKGQRTEKNIRGRAAVEKVEKEIQDKWVEADTPFILQHYGDGSPEALERRANFETNMRSSEAKKLTIQVFHVQATTGEPWDIGTLHYCEVPPEGIFDVFEVTELTYTVQNDKTLHTTLTLSPPPSSTSGAQGQAGSAASAQGLTGLGSLAGDLSSSLTNLASQGRARRASAGITFAPGQYPAPWSGPDVSVIQPTTPQDLVGLGLQLLSSLAATDAAPVAQLPQDFKSESENDQL